MRAWILVAGFLAVAPLTGCTTMRFHIPVSEASNLKTNKVRTLEGPTRTLESEYTLSMVALPGEVLLRDPADPARIKAYPKEEALRAPLLPLADAPLMKGPVRRLDRGPDLVLVSPDGRLTVEPAAVAKLRITQVDRGRALTTALGVGVGVLTLGIVIPVWVWRASPSP